MITQTFYPHVGGAEQQLMSLLPLIQSEGLNTVIITRRLPGTLAKEEICGAKVYRCPTLPGKILGSISFTFFSLYYLRKIKPNCLNAFQLLSPLTIAIIHRATSGVPIICKVQRGGALGDVARVKAKCFYKLRRRLLQSHVDAYQVISKEIQNELESIGVPANKLKLIPNGVVLDRYKPADDLASKMTLRSQLNLRQNEIIFVAVGRLVTVKNLHLLVEAWKTLNTEALAVSNSGTHKNKKTIRLLIVGEGPEQGNLMQLSEQDNSVSFLGRREDVAQILKASDVLVHVSASEGQSNAIMEGLSAGLPILATQVGAATDQVIPGYNGWLIPANDLHSLKNALQIAVSASEEYAHLGRNSRKHVENNYEIHKTATGLTTIYRQLIVKKYNG